MYRLHDSVYLGSTLTCSDNPNRKKANKVSGFILSSEEGGYGVLHE